MAKGQGRRRTGLREPDVGILRLSPSMTDHHELHHLVCYALGIGFGEEVGVVFVQGTGMGSYYCWPHDAPQPMMQADWIRATRERNSVKVAL